MNIYGSQLMSTYSAEENMQDTNEEDDVQSLLAEWEYLGYETSPPSSYTSQDDCNTSLMLNDLDLFIDTSSVTATDDGNSDSAAAWFRSEVSAQGTDSASDLENDLLDYGFSDVLAGTSRMVFCQNWTNFNTQLDGEHTDAMDIDSRQPIDTNEYIDWSNVAADNTYWDDYPSVYIPNESHFEYSTENYQDETHSFDWLNTEQVVHELHVHAEELCQNPECTYCKAIEYAEIFEKLADPIE